VIENRIAGLVGDGVDRIDELGGGLTHSTVVRAHLSRGGSVVAKIATDTRTADDVGFEHRALTTYELDCMPRVVGFSEVPSPMLVLEDLAGAHWPPPWPDVDAVFATIDELEAVQAGAQMPPLRDDRLPTWDAVMARRDTVAEVGNVSLDWLERVAPVLQRSARDATVEGDSLVHADIWSENVCFTDRAVVLVDWAGAARGNSDFDRAIVALDIFVTTDVLPLRRWPSRRAMASVIAALKCNAVIETSPDWVTEEWQTAQVAGLPYALSWAASEHGLPQPTPVS
jgi:hypothetical protein